MAYDYYVRILKVRYFKLVSLWATASLGGSRVYQRESEKRDALPVAWLDRGANCWKVVGDGKVQDKRDIPVIVHSEVRAIHGSFGQFWIEKFWNILIKKYILLKEKYTSILINPPFYIFLTHP